MARPDKFPEWATDTNYAAGADPWSGTATKIEPSSGVKAKGQIPATGFMSQIYNWLLSYVHRWIVSHDDTLFRDFYLKDDFCGSALATHLWTAVTTGADSAITIVEDDVANGRGALSLLNGTSGTRRCAIHTVNLDVNTYDFYIACRVRYVTNSINFVVGLGEPDTVNDGIVFRLDEGANTWDCGTSSNGSISTSSGVAPTTAYQLLEIKRISGVAYWYIDGVEVHAEAYATDLAEVKLFIDQSDNENSETRVDFISAWIASS